MSKQTGGGAGGEGRKASLVVQWLRISLPMQGTQVRALVWEDPTCRGATMPVSHNYWACALEPSRHNYWSLRAESLCSATKEATAMRSPRTTTKSSPCSRQLEKARVQQRRPNTANKLKTTTTNNTGGNIFLMFCLNEKLNIHPGPYLKLIISIQHDKTTIISSLSNHLSSFYFSICAMTPPLFHSRF